MAVLRVVSNRPRHGQSNDLGFARSLDDDGRGPGGTNLARTLPDDPRGAAIQRVELGQPIVGVALVEQDDQPVLPGGQ